MRALAQLPTSVWLIGLISLINDTASELVYPLLPLFLSGVLLAGPKLIGLIEGLADAVSALLRLLSGVLAERIGRYKPWIVFGYASAALSRPLLAVAGSWVGVLGLRLFDRLGKGLRSAPRDALLALSAPPEARGLAFGLHRALDNTGAVLGPLLAALLLGLGVGLHSIFLWTAVPGALCVLLALALKEPAGGPPVVRPSVDLRAPLPPTLRRYLLALTLFTLGGSSNAFLLLWAADRVGPAQAALLWALCSAVAALVGVPLSAWTDRIGRKRLILAGWIAYALLYALAALSWRAEWLWAWFCAYGVYVGATEGAERAVVADLTPRERLGSAYGWFNALSAAALLPASFGFGWLWERYGAEVAFLASALCAAGGAALLAGQRLDPVKAVRD